MTDIEKLSSDDPEATSASELVALSVRLADQGADAKEHELVELARSALKECWAEARRDATPWTFYRMGICYLCLRKAYPALSAWAKALQLSNSESDLGTACDALSALSQREKRFTGWEWLRRLRFIGAAGKFQSSQALSQIRALASKAPPISPLVTILAGGCKKEEHDFISMFRPLVIESFRAYAGTIISGGTSMGVSGLAADVQEAFSDSVHSIGYVPRTLTDAQLDERYSEIRRTVGATFSAMEPLQYWCDLLASGVPPAHVKILGIDGGSISASEYKIGLALGASVALLEGSGREAKKIRRNRQWRTSRGLVCIPPEPRAIAEFLSPIRSYSVG